MHEPRRQPVAPERRLAGDLSEALYRLLDDASQFPPGNLALEPAWEAHRRWRESERAAVVGRFLVPAARVGALAELLARDGGEGIDFGVVVSGGEVEGLGALADRVTSVELRGAVDDVQGWHEHCPQAQVFVEGAPVEAVARARERDVRVGAKLRCGGLEAAAFPSVEAVASFISDCVRLEVPFKATAGLHQPLRDWDPEIRVSHHGFLNLWAATVLAANGAARDELIACLEFEDAEAWWQLGLGVAELQGARRWFTAFGTCSIEEPLEGLAAIGFFDA
jgi:hypothetical protein